MVDFNVDAYYSGNNELLGASITVYDEEGVVDSITVSDATELNSFRTSLQNLLNTYIQKGTLTEQNLETILANNNATISINAKTLQGHGASDFSLSNHNHQGLYAPLAHASNLDNTPYGKGDTSNYGHVKLINNLNETEYTNGKALSAYQGKLLNDRITTLESIHKPKLTLGRYKDNTGAIDGLGWGAVTVNRGIGDGIGVKIEVDIPNFDYSDLTVHCVVNGVLYTSDDVPTLKFNSSGEAHMVVNGTLIPPGYVLIKVLESETTEAAESIIYMI